MTVDEGRTFVVVVVKGEAVVTDELFSTPLGARDGKDILEDESVMSSGSVDDESEGDKDFVGDKRSSLEVDFFEAATEVGRDTLNADFSLI